VFGFSFSELVLIGVILTGLGGGVAVVVLVVWRGLR
jgi:hypothetical protein